MLKIYFAASISGGRQDASLYIDLIKHLSISHKVLTEHIAEQSLTTMGNTSNQKEVFRQDVTWIAQCDIFIAETTTPSLGVGYEIGLASTLGKPILCLYRPSEGKKLSAMITGIHSATVKYYNTPEEAKTIINRYIEENQEEITSPLLPFQPND